MTATKKRVLLAFSGLPLTSDIFRLICFFVKDSAADVQLLRMHPPEDVVTERVHAEQLYSELKTLHAQFQQRGIPADFVVDPGRRDEPIVDYLARHRVDFLIFVPRKGNEGRLDSDEGDIVHTIFRNRRCPALMVA